MVTKECLKELVLEDLQKLAKEDVEYLTSFATYYEDLKDKSLEDVCIILTDEIVSDKLVEELNARMDFIPIIQLKLKDDDLTQDILNNYYTKMHLFDEKAVMIRSFLDKGDGNCCHTEQLFITESGQLKEVVETSFYWDEVVFLDYKKEEVLNSPFSLEELSNFISERCQDIYQDV